MAVTIYDIAARAGLSHAAVSMALRGSKRVSEATRERVRLLAGEMGYQPNFLARSLKAAETRMIAAVLPLGQQPFQDMLHDIQTQCTRHGYHVVWQNLPEDLQEQRFIFTMLGQGLFDGALVMLHEYEPLRDLIDAFIAGGRPMVVFGPPRDLPMDAGVCTVRVVPENALRSVTQLLIDQGHRKLIHVVHDPMFSYEAESHAVIVKTMRENGICDWDPTWKCSFAADGNDLFDGYRFGRELLAARTEVTAIQAPNDLFCIGFLRAMQEVGISVPEEISLVGSGNLVVGEYSSVRLTTINSPQMAVRGCQLLQAQLAAREKGTASASSHVSLQNEVVLRDSIAPVRSHRYLERVKG